MRARIVSIVLGLLLLTWAAPALAGGFAVTTLDAVPADIQAGQTYRIGYTVRQHGVRPVPDARTSIRLEGPDGQKLSFAGLPEGATGHYVAEVRVPAAGTWRWEVDQSPFPPQPLGTIEVRPAPAASQANAAAQVATPSVALGVLRVALPVAALGAATLFVTRALALARGGRRATAADRVHAA
jgi:hypothetical protein